MAPAAGVICLAKPGDAVTAGQPVLELRTDDAGRLDRARAALASAFTVGPEPPAPVDPVFERIA